MRSKWVNDSRSWKQLSKLKQWKKSLFPSNWTDEDIAEVVKKAEENIKDILLNEYNLPLKWEAWVDWKVIAKKDIKETFIINWKPIELKLWWKYNNNWNLDFRIITLYP